MATIKHIASKNADYGAAERYLIFQHNEFTNKPIRDEHGSLILREEYQFDTLNCGNDDFAIACMKSNLHYGKNNQKADVKSHHYIISFDPRDTADNGLTMEQAQEMGTAFCNDSFPGHQAIICTHPEGHNHSGNIHVHIVINSLRISEVERKAYMDRNCDTLPGMKHRCTSALMRTLRCNTMEMCQMVGLHQIDLLNGSKNRVTDREYQAERRGQRELDKSNADLRALGQKPKVTKFETEKEKLRNHIRTSLESTDTFAAFSDKLQQDYGIIVKESRGRYSYLTPDRTKPITARKLGDDFDTETILATLALNAEKSKLLKQKASIREQLQTEKSKPKQDTHKVRRTIDIEHSDKAKNSRGYEHWAKIHNIKLQAQTMVFLESVGLENYGQLATIVSEKQIAINTTNHKLKTVRSKLTDKKELQKAVFAIRQHKAVYDGYRTAKPKQQAAYRAQHETAISLYETASKKLAELYPDKKLPNMKILRLEIENLTVESNHLYTEYLESKKALSDLQTAKTNIDRLLATESDKARGNELS
nr:relaxase/mobilization nuclease domain-containing protein [uncultured Caproiciproducens sp.]